MGLDPMCNDVWGLPAVQILDSQNTQAPAQAYPYLPVGAQSKASISFNITEINKYPPKKKKERGGGAS